MEYYLYKRYSPFSKSSQSGLSDSLGFTVLDKSYSVTDPFTYSAMKFRQELKTAAPMGGLDDLLNLKLRMAVAKTDLILAQFDQITKQKEYSLRQILYDELAIDNLVHSLKPQIYKDYRRLFDFYKKKLDLRREARSQENWFLRNTMGLGMELRESLLETKMEEEKQGLLSDLEGEVGMKTFDKYTGGLNY